MTGSHSRRKASQGRTARGRRRRWRTRKKVEDVFGGGSNRTRRGFQLDPTTPNGADITRDEPGKKELEASVTC